MISHNRGDTFEAHCVRKNEVGVPIDITNTVIKSKMGAKGIAIELAATKTNAALGQFTLIGSAAATAKLPLGVVEWDIEYTDGDRVVSTKKSQIRIDGDVTRGN